MRKLRQNLSKTIPIGLTLILMLTVVICWNIKVDKLEKQLNEKQIEVNTSKTKVTELQTQVTTLQDEVNKKDVEIKRLNAPTISRGTTTRITTGYRIMNCSAYTASADECGNDLGITASGAKVQEWHTIACGKNIPFGTQIYIPYFKDYPNKGIFVCQDRGGVIGNNNIDIYMLTKSQCKIFGRRDLEVYILN